MSENNSHRLLRLVSTLVVVGIITAAVGYVAYPLINSSRTSTVTYSTTSFSAIAVTVPPQTVTATSVTTTTFDGPTETRTVVSDICCITTVASTTKTFSTTHTFNTTKTLNTTQTVYTTNTQAYGTPEFISSEVSYVVSSSTAACTPLSIKSGDQLVVLAEVSYSSGSLPLAVATDEYDNTLNSTTWPSYGYGFWETASYSGSDRITVSLSSPENMVMYCYDIRNAGNSLQIQFGSGTGTSVRTTDPVDPAYDYAVMAIMEAYSNVTVSFVSGPGFILQPTGTIPNGNGTYVSGEYVASTAAETSCPSTLLASESWAVMCLGFPPP